MDNSGVAMRDRTVEKVLLIALTGQSRDGERRFDGEESRERESTQSKSERRKRKQGFAITRWIGLGLGLALAS
ncbi:hypothetical protein F8388_006232 [Cannabis sativa]|uniref:Uncharacterized protein n=1 Tax=Cannabis sativa TaxID=3483 RepID=A0A7J6ICR6_CANSA|nr:hypothetical protein F8388_006232 [Cannabis sativa]KAF4404839.1 hypothetical protein G4B88_006225 [Cannabis sativa]